MTNQETDLIEQLLVPGIGYLTVFKRLMFKVIKSNFSKESIELLHYFLNKHAPKPKKLKRPRELFKKVIKEIRTRRLLYGFNPLFERDLKFLTAPGEAATPDPH